MKKNILANSFIIFLLLIVNSNKLTAQLYGSFPYNESFTSGVQPTEITILTPQSGVNSTTFTTNGMRLTAAVNSQFGAVYINNKQFASSNGIKIEFEYGMYGGTGADGLSFFLFDAAVASPVVGARGAGLGYGYTRANNSFSTNRESGLTGGYLGVGLDAFGNFKSQAYQGDRRMNGVQTAFTQPASQVTLRGKVGTLNLPNGLGLGYTGYPVLATQSTLSGVTAAATINPATGAYTTAGGLAGNFDLRTTTFTTNPNNSDYRKAFIELIPNAGGGFNVTVKIQHGTTVTTVINNYWYRTSYVYTENANPVTTDFNTLDTQGANTTQTLNTSVPTNFRIGFGASNGGLNDIHLIRGLKVTLPYSAISNNDSFTTCKNSSATIDPLTNDLAYSGPITGTPTASSSNIDPNSFQFIDAAGTPQGVSYTQSGVGTWTYAAATKLVTFSPVTGYTGVATIRYNVKGLTAPYNDDGYRSEPATITATVNNCFGCTSKLYLSQTNSLYEVVTSSNPFTYPLVGTASVNYNSTAINPLNGVMYGIQTPTSNVLVAINADGTSINLGAVSGLPTGVTYNSGEIDNLGNYYVKVNTNNNQLYKINLSTLTATLITLSASINVPDIAFNITNGLLYGINSTNGQLVSINPTTAVVTAIGITPGAVNFGAMFASSTGEMYGVDNLGGFYQFNLTTGQRVLISNAPASTANDGAHCVTAPISFSANLAITKTDGKATYIPGTTNTYTVVVSNNGPFGVLGATVSDPLPAGIPSGNVSYTIPVVTGGATTSITSAQTGALNDVVNLPVGGTITYTVNITIPSSFTGDLVNVATVTPPANSTDSTPANNTATDTDSSACAISATNPDSDGDGISNFCDLDDDNDGILDTVEGICDTQTVYTLNIPSTLAGATFGANGGSFNLVYTLTSGTAVASLGTSFTVPFSYSDFNNSINAQNHTWASFGSDATSFLIIPNGTSLFTGLPANNTTSENATGAVPASPDGWFRYWLDTNRITKLGTFTTTIGNLPTVSGLSSYSSNTGLNLFSSFNASSSTLVDSGYYAKMQLQNTANTANVGATLPLAVNYGNTYNWDYTAFSSTPGSGVGVAGRGLITISQNTITFCNQRDTDGDGTPDYLDLDSDGDGCPDAREGAGNFNPTTIASGTIASQTPNINFGTAVSTTTGVPTAVGAGQLVGQSQDASKNDCLDSDGDGIPDWQDLDDDNDGILDTVECTPTYLVRPVTTSSVTANKPITVGTAPQIADGEGAGGTGAGPFPNWYTNVSNLPIAFSMNMQSSSTIDHIKLYGPWGFNEWIGNFTIELYNAGNTLLGTENFVAPDQYTGTPIFSFTKEYTNVTRVRFTIVSSQGYSTVTPPRASVNEIVFLDLQPLTCDTDGDGIPNHLDLDSDNDGCLDAMEGDENVTVNMLVNAAPGLSVGTGSSASNQNLCASGTCVNANGVPTQVNSGGAADIGGDVGQGIGDSQDALISSGCYCYKPEVVVAGNPNPVKHGITALNRSNSGTSDWPVVRQSAWTVLESKTKGFVLNRMAFVDADSNTSTPTTPPLASIPAANYVEGMMVYDTVAQCLKIYNGTIWSCFSTQTCPD